MRRALLVGLAIGAVLVTPGSSRADFAFKLYAYGGGCDDRKDPITVIFYRYGKSGYARNHLRYHTLWDNSLGPDQYFVDHGYCQEEQWENASGSGDRFHIRTNQGMHNDEDLGWHTVGTPHHEDWIWTCPGHAVEDEGEGGHSYSGFDHGRRRVANKMDEAHYTYVKQLWNTLPTYQKCDGSWVASNGYVRYIRIPAWLHD